MLEFLTAGVVGTAITGIFNYKTQKLKNTHDVAMAKLDMEHLKVEAEANIKVTKARVEGEVELAEVDAMKNSYSMLSSNLFDKAYMKYIMERKWLSWCAVPITLMFALVDFLKHLARPALTYYLVGASTWITILCWKLMDGVTLTGTEAYDLFKLVVMTVIYLTASCVGWWFGDRRVSKFLNRLNDGNVKPK
jgi:hypothetical protein